MDFSTRALAPEVLRIRPDIRELGNLSTKGPQLHINRFPGFIIESGVH